MAYNKETATNFKDITGQRFGRLVAVERAGRNYARLAMWKCVCDCGNEKICTGASLRSGNTKSCGCLQRDVAKTYNTKHGLTKHKRLYLVWKTMKKRCLNTSDEHYDRYGGRGITVCDEWLHNFQAFYDWAMTNGYDENAPYGQCTLDRIDNNMGYSPDNCRWVDMKTQSNNRSTNREVKESEGN